PAAEGTPRPPPGGRHLPILFAGEPWPGDARRGAHVRREDARRLRVALRDLPHGRGARLGRGAGGARRAGGEAAVAAEGGAMTFETVAAALLRSSLQGALFIGAVWLACRLFPRLPAAVRCGLWWAACLKLLVGLVWIAPVEVPLLPADAGALTSPALLSRPLPPTLTGRGGRKQEKFVSPALLSKTSSPLFPSPGE